MKLVRIDDVDHAVAGKSLARPLLEGAQSNVRIIRLAVGQALPPHRHGESDLILYAVEGARVVCTGEANDHRSTHPEKKESRCPPRLIHGPAQLPKRLITDRQRARCHRMSSSQCPNHPGTLDAVSSIATSSTCGSVDSASSS